MTIAASTRERLLGSIAVAAACVYLVPFVARGWMPHDEGMLGQSADRVLHGALPHVGYEEPYAGALSWLYAAVFAIRGVDLVQVRWLLFIGACLAIVLVYAITRRWLRPLGAAAAAWVALVWSFPNYFAALPSWWLLLCALCCTWAFVRYVETGGWGDLAIAGIAAGAAVTVKQTGVYIAVALLTSIAYAFAPRLLRCAVALVAALLAAAILAPRLLHSEGVYLFLPVVACSVALCVRTGSRETMSRPFAWVTPIVVASAAAAVPVIVLVAPYIVRGHLWDFVNGTLLLPQKRLAFASMSMSPNWFALAGIPIAALVFARRATRSATQGRALTIAAACAVAMALPLAALVNVTAYQIVWQSTRAFGALVPIGICWHVSAHRNIQPTTRAILFFTASMLAWLSLNQFPFAAPIYFLYTAPLAVVATVAIAHDTGALRRDAMLAWAGMLVLFAVASANRGYIQNLGVAHERQIFDTPLDLPRAHLSVSDGDAHTYRTIVAAIGSHLTGGRLVAGPDCPEVYFLAGLTNPSGALFDFFSTDADADARRWLTADTIVVNHEPWFSPRLSDELMMNLRREFPRGENVGRFEIRWR